MNFYRSSFTVRLSGANPSQWTPTGHPDASLNYHRGFKTFGRLVEMNRFVPRSPLGLQLARHRDTVLSVAKAHHASHVRVFGSVVRGEDGPDSDIDLLVDLEDPTDIFNLLSLERALEQILGVHVDAGTKGSLRSRVRDEILAESLLL